MNDTPESVEEAGALLGAAITKCNVTSLPSVKPPKGMHSSFATMSPVPSSELFCRLYQLRQLLRQAPRKEPLVAAPSLLAVLMKLLGVSSSLAPQFMQDGRVNTPPLWSTPLRTLWVDSVVLCHVLGDSLTGKARIDIYSFVKNMVALAGLNPKSQKAAGGTRMAALQVIAGLFLELPQKLSPWALDVLSLCTKSLKSSGNGEPSYRLAAVEMAAAVAIACREARLELQQQQDVQSSPLVLAGAVEDRALQESLKILKQATTDKYPEVRQGAAHFCAALAPLLVLPIRGGDKTDPTASLEDAIQICFKNLDDESTAAAIAWAEALARCLSTAIAHGQQQDDSNSRRKDASDSDVGDDTTDASRFSSSRNTKTVSAVATCKSLPVTVKYLVEQFLKVRGELAALRLGGPFSIGGRAVRVGIGMVLVKLLAIQSANTSAIGVEYTIKQILIDVLAMVGPELEKQLGGSDATSAGMVTAKATGGFGFGSKAKSPADGGLARLATSRVLREGLAEIASEPTQLSMLHELTALCVGQPVDQHTKPLNAQQLQVALIEISHLLSTLGEAAGSALEDLLPLLTNSLKHPDHGVRHETAVACAAVAASFPGQARQMLRVAMEEIQGQLAELVTQTTFEEANAVVIPKKLSRFGGKTEAPPPVDKSLHFQYAIHGHALLIAILLRELPQLPGGLPAELLAMAMSVGEILVTCQNIEILTRNNPIGACTCVRAGYGIVCGALTVGPDPISPHISLMFGLWQKAGKTVEEGGKNFTADHDLICLDAALSSIVAFLEHCSELLLMVPDALSQTTITLEQLFPLFLPNGRLDTTPSSPAAASRHESAKASIMEAFAWLPPGSFPMVANEVFSFALQHVQSATEAEVMSSLLPSLVNNEDEVLDAKSICRAQRYGQVGGGRDVDHNCIVLNSEVTHHGERESVMHFQSSTFRCVPDTGDKKLWGSRILGMVAYDGIDLSPPPTPLHEVGTWRKPVSPSCSSKVRLVDAAVQAFSATFGLKDGKEQQHAMLLLEQMIPPLLAQLARAMGVNTSLTEDQRRSKAKSEDVAAVANITAVLLACLKSLPLHEATHDIPIGLGPPWMNKAKDLLLTLLPSTSNTVRRAAAEGLALLATLGVTEDAHTLQSAVLHSLDEVMQGNKPDGKPRAIPVEPVSAARAGSLLTLGCIQRTAHNIKMIQRARSKGRSTTSESVAAAQQHALPTMQMMTRILPSISCHAVIRDAFIPRTYGIHAFNVLLAYSTYQKVDDWTAEDHHLIKKAIESVLDNFLSCWTAISTDMDGEQAPEKLSAEVSFLAVILRMMTSLVPYLDESTSSRFVQIASMVGEEAGSHPVILVEAMGFFEVLAMQEDLPCPATLSKTVEKLVTAATPMSPNMFAAVTNAVPSTQCAEAGALLMLTVAQALQGAETGLSSLFGLLNTIAGLRPCTTESFFRGLAAPREVDENHARHLQVENSIIKALAAQPDHLKKSLHFMTSQNRWQVRAVASTFICEELKPKSKLSPEVVSEVLLAACGAVVATSETEELRPVQEVGAKLLAVLVDLFGQVRDPTEPDSLLMEQYSSQLLASAKHSVTLPGGDEDEGARRLFVIGCATLEALIQSGLLSEATSFKRLVRPVLPTPQEIKFVKLESDPSGSPFRGIPVLSHVAKLATVSRIAALIDNGIVPADCASFFTETTQRYKAELAVHCSAVALDGWRLLKDLKQAGFFYGNARDLDEDTRTLLVKAGPPCLCNAMICLSEIVGNVEVDNGTRNDCKAWLEVLLPLALVAFHRAVKDISDKDTTTPEEWMDILLPSEMASFYLQGLRSMVQSSADVTEELGKGAIAEITSKVSTAILLPAIGLGQLEGGDGEEHRPAQLPSDQLVVEACKFVETVAASMAVTAEVESNLLVTLLTPLDALQRNSVSLESANVVRVIVANMKAMTSMIDKGSTKASLVNAMLQFSIELLSRDMCEELRIAAESMLAICLSNDAITKSRQQSIAIAMAQHGKWKAWSIIGSRCPSALSKSLTVTREALEDLQDPARHVGALEAVRTILQDVDAASSPVVGTVLQEIGASCLGLFKAYATLALPIKDLEANRMAVSADAMKIIMVSYQSLSAGENQPLIAYLSVIFDLLIEVIQYNGLPNQTSPQVGANPMLGRLAAHSIVHVARTTPVAFKETVAGLTLAHARAVLEFAVRAEMSGYAAVAGATPQKKKLNLKSFQK
jgi:hypothetical protein